MGENGATDELARAKINLDLHVLGRREDGYHELDSLVVFASIGDRLRFERQGTFELRIEGRFAPGLPTGRDNLVTRAALGLAALAGRSAEIKITLDKRLPVAAGIGGGSADAAAVLRGLARLWDLDSEDPELRAFALRLGADVPVCLRGRPAHLQGKGERLAELDWPDMAMLLVTPNVSVLTARVFAERRAQEGGPRRPCPRLGGRFDQRLAMLEGGRNDLQPAATRLAPAVARALDHMASQPGCWLARMSGSGPTCFGLFADTASASAGGKRIQLREPSWWVADCTTAGNQQPLA